MFYNENEGKHTLAFISENLVVPSEKKTHKQI